MMWAVSLCPAGSGWRRRAAGGCQEAGRLQCVDVDVGGTCGTHERLQSEEAAARARMRAHAQSFFYPPPNLSALRGRRLRMGHSDLCGIALDKYEFGTFGSPFCFLAAPAVAVENAHPGATFGRTMSARLRLAWPGAGESARTSVAATVMPVLLCPCRSGASVRLPPTLPTLASVAQLHLAQTWLPKDVLSS